MNDLKEKTVRFTMSFDQEFVTLFQAFVNYLNDKKGEEEPALKEQDAARIGIMRWMQETDFFRYLSKYHPELAAQVQMPGAKG